MPSALGALIGGDDGGAAEPDVVLERRVDPRDLAAAGVATQLPRELGALREAGRAERVALRDEPAGGVDHPATAVCVLAVIDDPRRVALLAQAESLVEEQLVRAEAVVKL